MRTPRAHAEQHARHDHTIGKHNSWRLFIAGCCRAHSAKRHAQQGVWHHRDLSTAREYPFRLFPVSGVRVLDAGRPRGAGARGATQAICEFQEANLK